MNKLLVQLSAIFVFALCIHQLPAHECEIISHVDGTAPSPDDCRKMGVKTVWFGCGLPFKLLEDGHCEWTSESAKGKVEDILKKFEGSGLSVIPLPNIFYEKNADKGQVCRIGGTPAYRCFSAPADDLTARLSFLAKELSAFKSFGGICIDDEPGLLPGGCVCERCKKLFKDKYGIEAPSNDAYLSATKGVVPDGHPVLLWQEFQDAQMRNYYATLADTIKRAAPGSRVMLIPAAAYFSGKHLSIPNCKPEDFFKAGRRVTLDSCHIRDFQLYSQFYMNDITQDGWKAKAASGLCLYMMKSGLPNFPNIPIYDAAPQADAKGRKAISVPAFKRYILQSFAEGTAGIVYFPGSSLSPEHTKIAIEAYDRTIAPICKATPKLQRLKGRIAILYSTTTETFASLWRNNPVERYRQIHECDALAYFLLKKGIPFDMILEAEFESYGQLKDYAVVIAVGTGFIAGSKEALLKNYAAKGGKLILCGPNAVKIDGAADIDADPDVWYRAVEGGNQRPADMEYQAGLLETALGKALPPGLTLCESSSRSLNVNFLTDGQDIYLAVVNDDLNAPISATLKLDREYCVDGVAGKLHLDKAGALNAVIEPADMKMFRLSRPSQR